MLGLKHLTPWARPGYSLGMKTWMLVAAVTLAPLTAYAAPVTAPVVDESVRAQLVSEIEATRTALLPQMQPLPQVTVRYQPRLNDVKAAVQAAKTLVAFDKAKKDFADWKRVLLSELHTEDQRAMPTGETLRAFTARRGREIGYVMAVRQEFVAQRAQVRVEAVRAAGMGSNNGWGNVFDNSSTSFGLPQRAPASANLSAPFTGPSADGAVKADALQGDAKYAKLRSIAVKEWKADPKIVDAAIAEAVRQNVDPALVLAVIWQESRFNTRATSPVGARGLMQVMPDTGRGLGVSNPDMLYDMKTNLRAGVKYLRNAASYLKLNVDLADISDAAPNKIKALLASYNAGIGAVSKWLRQQGSDLVRIPYAETRHYVKVIGDKLAGLGTALGW